MTKQAVIVLFMCFAFNFFSQSNGAVHKGFYLIYESISYDTKLKQKVTSAEFSESYRSEISSYPAVKLGYSFTAWGNIGLTNWTVWGVDFGIGLNYNKSIMNALQPYENIFQATGFEQTSQNNQVFFNYYQPGNQCKINDYGINLHLDAGTIIYAGAEIDAGPSSIVFLDNRIQDQKVKSLGWFVNARIQGGISLPLPLRVESDVKVNLKAYAVLLGWSARHYKLDWISGDKKLKNFSTLQANGSPLGVGVSMSILFKSY